VGGGEENHRQRNLRRRVPAAAGAEQKVSLNWQ
jgi:hypothetical protein